jgi:NADH-quinone oxidoreductase subunit M
MRDVGWREAVIFAPLVALTILFGVAPKPVLDMSAASVANLLDGYNKAIAAKKTAAAGAAEERKTDKELAQIDRAGSIAR